MTLHAQAQVDALTRVPQVAFIIDAFINGKIPVGSDAERAAESLLSAWAGNCLLFVQVEKDHTEALEINATYNSDSRWAEDAHFNWGTCNAKCQYCAEEGIERANAEYLQPACDCEECENGRPENEHESGVYPYPTN